MGGRRLRLRVCVILNYLYRTARICTDTRNVVPMGEVIFDQHKLFMGPPTTESNAAWDGILPVSLLMGAI